MNSTAGGKTGKLLVYGWRSCQLEVLFSLINLSSKGVGRVGTKAAVSAELGFEEFLFTNESLCEIVEFWGRG